jgi:hypothetical protein
MWREENGLELMFEGAHGPRVLCVSAGPIGASDVSVGEGSALELFAEHLREEESATYAEIVANWRLEDEPDAQWAVGSRLTRPVRLEMTVPYVETVGFAFDCERHNETIGRLMLFASADILFAVCEDHVEVAKYGLREQRSDEP